LTGTASAANATFTVDLGFTANELTNMPGSGSNFGGRASYLVSSGTVNPTWTASAGVCVAANAVFLGQ
jgi:hypothetical protein